MLLFKNMKKLVLMILNTFFSICVMTGVLKIGNRFDSVSYRIMSTRINRGVLGTKIGYI